MTQPALNGNPSSISKVLYGDPVVYRQTSYPKDINFEIDGESLLPTIMAVWVIVNSKKTNK